MSISRVQKSAAAVSGTNVTSVNATLPANVTDGNMVVACIQTSSATVTVSSCSDLGVTMAQAIANTNTGLSVYLWYGFNAVSGGLSSTITVSALTTISACLAEYSKTSGTWTLDKTGINSGSSASPSTASITASAPNAVYVAVDCDDGGNGFTAGPTNSFATIADNQTNFQLGTADKVDSVIAAESTGWTTAASHVWATVIADFTDGGGGVAAVGPAPTGLLPGAQINRGVLIGNFPDRSKW